MSGGSNYVPGTVEAEDGRSTNSSLSGEDVNEKNVKELTKLCDEAILEGKNLLSSKDESFPCNSCFNSIKKLVLIFFCIFGRKGT